MYEIIPTENTAIDTPSRLEDLIDRLLKEFYAEKFEHSQSQRTVDTYQEILRGFRLQLQLDHTDLIIVPDGYRFHDTDQIRRYIAEHAKIYAVTSKREGKHVAPSTRNLRLAALSSFYIFAEMNIGKMHANPITLIKKSKVEKYSGAHWLEKEDLQLRLAAIDTSTTQGLRDYILLLIMITTGRRAMDIVNMRKEHLSLARTGVITILFPHMKGGKAKRVPLDVRVSILLRDYLETYYTISFYSIPDDAPVWVSHSFIPNKYQQAGEALTYEGIRYICMQRLDQSKVHITRHTAVSLRIKKGAPVEELQSFLDHANINTTMIYAKELLHQQDKYMSSVVDDLL